MNETDGKTIDLFVFFSLTTYSSNFFQPHESEKILIFQEIFTLCLGVIQFVSEMTHDFN